MIILRLAVLMTLALTGCTPYAQIPPVPQLTPVTARPLAGGDWSYSPTSSTIEFLLFFDAQGVKGSGLRQEASVWRSENTIYVAGLIIDLSSGNTFGRKDDYRAKSVISNIETGIYTVIDALTGEKVGEIDTTRRNGGLVPATVNARSATINSD